MSSDIGRELKPDEMADTIGLPQGRFSRREIQIQLAKAQVEKASTEKDMKWYFGTVGVALVVSILPGVPESLQWLKWIQEYAGFAINPFLILGIYTAYKWFQYKAEVKFWEPLWQAGGTAFNLNNLREQTVSYYQNLPK